MRLVKKNKLFDSWFSIEQHLDIVKRIISFEALRKDDTNEGCCDLSRPGLVAGQTVTMRVTVTVQLLPLTKFVKLKQNIISLNF